MKTLEDFLALDNDIRNRKREFENEYFKSEVYQKLENDENVIFNELVELITKELDAQNIEDACYSHGKNWLQANEIEGVDYCIESDYFTILGKPITKELLENTLISNALEQYCYDSSVYLNNRDKENAYFSVSTAHEAFITYEGNYYNAELSRNDKENWANLHKDYNIEHGTLLHEKVCDKSGIYNGLYRSDYYGSPSELNLKVNQKFRDKIENVDLFLEIIELDLDASDYSFLDELYLYDYLGLSNDVSYYLEDFELLELNIEDATAKFKITYTIELEDDSIEKTLTKEIKL